MINKNTAEPKLSIHYMGLVSGKIGILSGKVKIQDRSKKFIKHGDVSSPASSLL